MACLALSREKTLQHGQMHELIRTLCRTRNPQPDHSLRTKANLTFQKFVTLPAALQHIAGAPPAAPPSPELSTIQRPAVLHQPLPDDLQAFIRAHPEAVLGRCQQKIRAVVEQAIQEGTPVAAGVIQLLRSIVKDLDTT